MASGAILLVAALTHLCAGVIAAPAPAKPQLPLAAGALAQHPLGDTPPPPPPITGEKKAAKSRKLHGRFLHITGESRRLVPAPPSPSAPPRPGSTSAVQTLIAF